MTDVRRPMSSWLRQMPANLYRRLVAADLSQRMFLCGWRRRAEVFKVSTSAFAKASADKEVTEA